MSVNSISPMTESDEPSQFDQHKAELFDEVSACRNSFVYYFTDVPLLSHQAAYDPHKLVCYQRTKISRSMKNNSPYSIGFLHSETLNSRSASMMIQSCIRSGQHRTILISAVFPATTSFRLLRRARKSSIRWN